MRKNLELLSIAALAVTWGITLWAFFGPNPLPAHIPTHFDAGGQPTSWAAPVALWTQPAVSTFVYLLIALVARIHASFNFPIRMAARNREAVQGLSIAMLSWLKAEMLCLFAILQVGTIQSARAGRDVLPGAIVPIAIVAVWGTLIWHFFAMRRAAVRRWTA